MKGNEKNQETDIREKEEFIEEGEKKGDLKKGKNSKKEMKKKESNQTLGKE